MDTHDTHTVTTLRDALVINTTEMDLLSNKPEALLSQKNILLHALWQRIVEDDHLYCKFKPLTEY